MNLGDMKVILVDPSSSDTGWRSKSSLSEASKGIKNRMKKFSLTTCPEVRPPDSLVFHNTHIRKSLSDCRFSVEELESKSGEMHSKTQSSVQSPVSFNTQKKLIFKDAFGSEYFGLTQRQRLKRPLGSKIHKDLFVPYKDGLGSCKSEQSVLRTPNSLQHNLKLITFHCPMKVSQGVRPLDFKGRNPLGVNGLPLGKKTDFVCDQPAASLPAQEYSKETDDLNLAMRNQSFNPVQKPGSEWRIKKARSKVLRSDTSCHTCKFRCRSKNGKSTRAGR